MNVNVRLRTAYVVVKAVESLSTGWVFGTYVLFLVSHDLTLLEINRVNGFYMLCGFLLEPFTGSIADRYGQKKVYMIGQGLGTLGLLIYGFSSIMSDFYVAEFMSAIGATFSSQALESWLRNRGGVESSHSTIARGGMWGRIVTIPAALIGTYVGSTFSLAYPWFIGFFFGVMTVALTHYLLGSFPESETVTNGGIKGDLYELWSNITKSVVLLKGHQDLRFVVLINVVSVACFQPFNMFWSVIFTDLSGSMAWLGVVWMFVAIFTAVGMFLASRQGKISRGTVGVWLFSICLPMLPVGLFTTLTVAVSGFLFHEIGRGGLRPVLGTYSNQHIPDNIRSTASSLISATMFLGALLGLQVSGYLTTIYSPATVWSISAVILLILSIYAMLSEWKG